MKFVAIVIGVFITFLNSMICTCDTALNFTEDAEIIRKVMKESELQTEQKIAEILVDRNNAQRQDIAREYQKLYKTNMLDDLRSFFVYDIKEAVSALMTPNDHFYAYELHHAIEGFGTDENAISEILGSMSRDEILEVSKIYINDYGVSLKDDIISDTSGEFQELLVAMCEVERNEDEEVDGDAAIADAQALNDTCNEGQDPGLSKFKSIFRTIFLSRSRLQLKLIFDEYEKISNTTIIDAIKDHFTNEIQYAYLIIMKSVVLTKLEFYAVQLRESMMGLGTDDRQLIRILVGRSEIDLGKIIKTYEILFNTELSDSVSSDTSGKYRDMLLRLIKKYKL